jgi:integrase
MSINRRTTRNGDVRYDVRLRDPFGRVYNRTFRTKREAGAFELGQRADRTRGVWFDVRASDTTFAIVAKEWLDGNPGKRSGTAARDSSVVNCHLVPALGNYAVGRISPGDVQRLVNTWSGRYAPATVRRHYAVLRAILSHATTTDLIGRSPCRNIKLPSMEHEDRHLPNADGLVKLTEAIGPDLTPMVYVAAVLGLRWGECAGLRVGRIDFLHSTLTVAEQITRGYKGASIKGPPKSRAGRRTLAVPQELMTLLAAHLSRRGLTVSDTDVRVFVGQDGADLEYANFRKRSWAPACGKAGFPDLTFHDLRRLAATALVAEGVDMKTAQTRLGHASPQMTLGLYAQVTGAGDRNAARRVGRRLMRGARDGRAMESKPPEEVFDAKRSGQEDSGGARKNRTSDLSIISAAL